MAAKPLIGINMDYRSSRREHEALSFIAAGYFDGVTNAGGIPVILPPLTDEDDIARLLDMLDGVVLVGGADVDSRRDGFMIHPASRQMDVRREDFDRMLVKAICQRQMPVLAIGSGMQLLNITEGERSFSIFRKICRRRCRTKIRSTQRTGTASKLLLVRPWNGFMVMVKFASTACITWRSMTLLPDFA